MGASEVAALNSKLDQVLDQQKQLIDYLMVSSPKVKWLNEDVAAALLDIEPRTLRTNAISWGINYRNTNGRSFQYHKGDLERYQEKTRMRQDSGS